MSSFGDEAPILIRTKLQRPRLGPDLVPRSRLVERLNQGVDRKLTLISAQAGAGKTTLLAQWLEEHTQRSAWLSLDRHDNDLSVFVSYLCAAIQSVNPEACRHVLDLLNAPFAPPLRIITTSIVNELDTLFRQENTRVTDERIEPCIIIVLDDYQNITEPAVHALLTELINFLPQCAHLVLATRRDPPLPLAGLRASNEMSELRTHDLSLTREEAEALLVSTTGRKLSSSTVDLLASKTDGWAVGLRLAGLSISESTVTAEFAEWFKTSSSSAIVDYLVDEVLSRLSPTQQDFLLRTSILDRLNPEICDVLVFREGVTQSSVDHAKSIQSRRMLDELLTANLFLIPLDLEGRWFRYHHLFLELLRQRLRRQYSAEEIADLRKLASNWFESKGYIQAALDLAFSAEDLDSAARIVAGQRYKLMNQARWQRLDSYLRLFPSELVNQNPDLLIMRSWLVYHQGHYDQLPATLQQLGTVLDQTVLPTESMRHLKGEICALRSLLYYYQADMEQVISNAEFAIQNTPPELWIVRILARLFLAGAYQNRGELGRAYEAYYQGLDEEDVQSNRFKATLLMAGCNVPWIAADLQRLEDSASQCVALCDFPYSTEIQGYGKYHLGRVFYQHNNLDEAEKLFDQVVQKPYLNYGLCVADSAFGLGLVYQAQNRQAAAREIASFAVAHMVDTRNTTLLKVAQAFRAEIALRQGQQTEAEQWASQFETIPPLMPMVSLYEPHITLAKIWMAGNMVNAIQRAAELLDQLRKYAESTCNTITLIQVLALQAILFAKQGEEQTALNLTGKALALGEPGGLIRLFVDFGPPMAQLLHALNMRGTSSDYLSRMMTAFPEAAVSQEQLAYSGSRQTDPMMVDPLTPRETEVLELLAQRLTNKEIASKLVVSPGTIKTHTVSIYTKLDVHSRRRAVEKAQELNLIPQS